MNQNFFSVECHEAAHRLSAASAALEASQAELTAARAALAEAERMGDRTALVSANRAVSEAEMVCGALAKQRDTLAGILRDSICEGSHAASRLARSADMTRRTAGEAAMLPFIESALEAVRSAVAAFNEAAGGTDLISDMAMTAERKALVVNLSADEVRPVPAPAIIGSRHLCPPELGDIERVLSKLLP